MIITIVVVNHRISLCVRPRLAVFRSIAFRKRRSAGDRAPYTPRSEVVCRRGSKRISRVYEHDEWTQYTVRVTCRRARANITTIPLNFRVWTPTPGGHLVAGLPCARRTRPDRRLKRVRRRRLRPAGARYACVCARSRPNRKLRRDTMTARGRRACRSCLCFCRLRQTEQLFVADLRSSPTRYWRHGDHDIAFIFNFFFFSTPLIGSCSLLRAATPWRHYDRACARSKSEKRPRARSRLSADKRLYRRPAKRKTLVTISTDTCDESSCDT